MSDQPLAPHTTIDQSGQTVLGNQTNSATSIHLTRLDPANRRNQRNHAVLRQAVRRFWIEGVLHSSLYNAVLIRLGLDLQPGAVDNRPWNLILHQPGQPSYTIAADKPLVELFDDMDQQLLILGEPGFGKTTTLLALADGLLTRTAADPTLPTPVIFNLSSWAETQLATRNAVSRFSRGGRRFLQKVLAVIMPFLANRVGIAKSEPNLEKWLIKELNTRYQIPHKVAQIWIANDELLLLLDGLDEVAEDQRADCVDAINRFRHEHVVAIAVCSRTAEYAGLATRLKLVGAVAISPLTPPQIEGYITHAGPHVAALRHVLATNPELRDLAQTPLLLSIMTLAYQDRGAPALIPDIASRTVRQQLFDRYISRMFQLIGLSFGLDSEIETQTHLNFSWKNGLFSGLVGGLMGGLSFGVQELASWQVSKGSWEALLKACLMGGLGFGLMGGLSFGLMNDKRSIAGQLKVLPNQGIWQSLKNGLIFELIFVISGWLIGGLQAGLSFGLIAGLMSGLGACSRHLTLRWLLYFEEFMPWNYARFLDYAASRLFLRKVGGGYVFVHRLLLEHFASLTDEDIARITTGIKSG